MIFDFAFFLTMAVLITGLITLLDVMILAPRRLKNGSKQSLLVEYARAFFPVLLLVWVIRSFVVQPYRVPTSSLVPTILPGDLIVVKQYEYGLRMPVLDQKVVPISNPKRGQIALFRYPLDPTVTYIKRVIGLPGDHIVYRNKILYINGKEAKQKFLDKTHYFDDNNIEHTVYRMQENLEGVKHDIFLDADDDEMNSVSNAYDDVVVPPGHYFMMGDNRDDSGDSRIWGFVPDQNLIGQAGMVFMSWDSRAQSWQHKIRWDRVGTWLTPNKTSSTASQPQSAKSESAKPAVSKQLAPQPQLTQPKTKPATVSAQPKPTASEPSSAKPSTTTPKNNQSTQHE